MKLVKTNAGWEVLGNGAERARLAWAIAERGELVYSLASNAFEFRRWTVDQRTSSCRSPESRQANSLPRRTENQDTISCFLIAQ